MATIDLGKIKLVWKGTYNNSTAYTVDDVVEYTDSGITSTYICVANSTGNAPSSSGTAHASWNYMAKGVADPIPTQSSSTNGKALVSDGTNASWGDSGAWTKLAGGTGPSSNVAGINIDNVFSADYKFYKLYITWTQDDYLRFRWIKTSDGAAQEGSNYIWTQVYQAQNAGNGPNRYGGDSQSRGQISYWNASDNKGCIIEITIQDPYNSSEYSMLTSNVGSITDALRIEHQIGVSTYNAMESHRGIFLYGAGGDSINSLNFRYVLLGAKI